MRRRGHLIALLTVVLLCGTAGAARAAVPAPITQPPASTGATTADFQAYIADGGDMTAHFEYAPAASPFCLTGVGAVSSTPEQPVGWRNDFKVPVTGLSGGTTYCVEVVASNAVAAGVRGGVVSFTAGAFDIWMGPAYATSPTAVTVVGGSVRSHGQPTTVAVEYALQGSPFCVSEGASGDRAVSPSVELPGSDGFEDFSVSFGGLSPGATYCLRAVGVAASTATARSWMTEIRDVGFPVLAASSLTGVSPTAQRVGASLRTAGQATLVRFEYSERSGDADPFCVEDGGGRGQHATPDVLLDAGPGEHAVDVVVDQLTTGADYCYRVVASNATGSWNIALGELVAGAPDVVTRPATDVTSANATLHAAVDGEGAETTVAFDMASAASPWCTTSGSEGTPNRSAGSVVAGDTAVHEVALTVALAGGDYCYRAVATNARGTVAGGFETFHILVPPVNTGAPSIGGTPAEGETLTIDDGAWSSPTPLTFYYDWVRCTPDACDLIPEAFEPTYLLTAADVGTVVFAFVTAVNDDGEAYATTQDVEVEPAPLGNSVPPTVAGEMLDGERLTANVGVWTGPSLRLLLQWRRCDAAGGACEDIDQARQGTYVLTGADVGHVVRLAVAGIAGGESLTIHSPVTPVVRPAPPKIVYDAEVHGTAYDGYALTAWEGRWSGTQPMRFAWRWRRCDAVAMTTCTDIPDATDPAYVLTPADVGSRIRVVVTATNAAGSTSSTSNVSFPIGHLSAPSTVVVPPPQAPGVFDRLTAARVQTDLRLRAVAFSVVAGVPQARLVAQLFARERGRRVLVGQLKTTAGGPSARRVSLSARGRALVASRRSVSLTLVVTVTAPGGRPIVRQAPVTLRRAAPPRH